MEQDKLVGPVQRFAQTLLGRPVTDLDLPWAWGEYADEGIRFACFRTYEELVELSVQLSYERSRIGKPISSAQHILGCYHSAVRDLHALLAGLTAAQLNQAPGEKDWSLRHLLAHVLSTDLNFYVVVRYTLDGSRKGDHRPLVVPDEQWNAIAGIEDPELDVLFKGPADDLLGYQGRLRWRILAEFAGMSEEELALPSRFWESHDYPLRFRLHRIESHVRQHTIHAEKILAANGVPYDEIRQLVRMLHRGLAQAESALIGAEEVGADLVDEAARAIGARASDIAARLQN